MRFPGRLPFLFLGILALLTGLWSGVMRLGWSLPWPQTTLVWAHGPLMVVGFLGTLISLERAVAWRARWAYATPLFTGLGALMLIAFPAEPMGRALMTLGSLGLVLIFGFFLRVQQTLHMKVMTFGALSWLVGNASTDTAVH